MRFGTLVIVRRGGGSPPGTPGCEREVRGVYIGAENKYILMVRLSEDDPLSTVPEWSKAGDVGYWSACAVRPQENGGAV